MKKKKGVFWIILNVSLPRRTDVRLSEGVNLLSEDWFFALVKGGFA